MASGLVGRGASWSRVTCWDTSACCWARTGRLRGRKIVVTAGGTQEPIDPVRVIANRSSGKQGYALAQAALDAGAQVTLITGPISLKPPVGAEVRLVQTAAGDAGGGAGRMRRSGCAGDGCRGGGFPPEATGAG